MPLYEYICLGCKNKLAVLVGVVADKPELICPKCGGRDLQKLISRFARLRSEDEIIDSLEDSVSSANMDDPESMSRIMREMGKEMDEEDGENLDEYLEEAQRDLNTL